MRIKLCKLLPLLILWTLASCNIGKAPEWPDTEVPDYPGKTMVGADKLVCMVNSDLNLQVYREVPGGLFNNHEEVQADRWALYTTNGTLPSYRISVDRGGDSERPEYTNIEMVIQVDTAYPDMPYRLLGGGYSSYTVGQLNTYVVDEANSSLVFSRVDSLIAAGHFVFKAVNDANDTVVVRGYFDIPFRDK